VLHVKPKHAAEAAATILLRTAGDQATLASITESLDRGLTQADGGGGGVYAAVLVRRTQQTFDAAASVAQSIMAQV
jgi:hypothetical protein